MSVRPMLARSLGIVGSLLLTACLSPGPVEEYEDAAPSAQDASHESHPDSDAASDSAPDTSPRQDARTDAGPDAPPTDAPLDAPTADADTCTGSCQSNTVVVDFDGATMRLEHAFYGLTPPEHPGDPWTIHFEVVHGGSSSCPTQSSPTPEGTLVLSNIPVTGPADHASASFVDFSGKLLSPNPTSRATKVVVSGLKRHVCTSCAKNGQSDPDGFVALDIELTFPDNGSARGHAYAIHCNSMDL